MKVHEQDVMILKLRFFGRALTTKCRENVIIYKTAFKDAGGKKDGREMFAAKFDCDKDDDDDVLFKGLRGTALCSAEDAYDEAKGIQIAIDKLIKQYYRVCKHQIRLDMIREAKQADIVFSRFDSKIEKLNKSIEYLATNESRE